MLLKQVIQVSIIIALMAISTIGFGHNKVVVIPLGGDDAVLDPFALIPADNTSPANYTSANGVTLDMVTGLEWQQQDSNVDYNYNGAVDYCSNLTLDGKSNWRLPTANELLSIVDFGTFSPAIDGSAFPSTESKFYWTATDNNEIDDRRWAFDFNSGEQRSVYEKTTTNYRARCVRSNGQNALVQVFNDNGDGSVTDLASGLIWQQQNDGVKYTQVAAISYCQNLVLAGGSNWRLPEAKELASLLDYREQDPVIDEQLFSVPSGFADFWSASSNVGIMNNAWGVGFRSGDVFPVGVTIANFARCVR